MWGIDGLGRWEVGSSIYGVKKENESENEEMSSERRKGQPEDLVDLTLSRCFIR